MARCPGKRIGGELSAALGRRGAASARLAPPNSPSLTIHRAGLCAVERRYPLKSATFFEVEKFPIAFASRTIEKQADGYLVRSPFTIHGVTKEVEVPMKFNGEIHDVRRDHRIGFEGHLKLNRKDYCSRRPRATTWPEKVFGYIGLGNAHAMLGNRDQAIATLKKAVAITPEAPGAQVLLRRLRG